jgi:dephospho-CoA kinase
LNNASPFAAFEVWGLTGGIASGKSTAARIFAEEGIPVIDADQVSRELSAPGGAAYAEILGRFGTADRAELRKLVFADDQARKDLEAILHPQIVAESLKRMQSLGAPRVIYEATLLVETGRYKELTGLIVIDAPRDLRRARLIGRDGVEPELADRILASQIDDQRRREAATVVVPNAGTVDELRARVRDWIQARGWKKVD